MCAFRSEAGNAEEQPQHHIGVEARECSVEHHLGLSATAENNEGNVNSSWEIPWCFLAAPVLGAFLGHFPWLRLWKRRIPLVSASERTESCLVFAVPNTSGAQGARVRS